MTDAAQPRYQAFLSHNSADKPAVEELARRLEQAGISAFLDKWHLIPGEPWQQALEDALDRSETCVVFVGPSGLGPWQNEEMRAAIDRRVSDHSRTFRVVPVLLPGAQREQRSKLPTFLAVATWVEFPQTLDNADGFHRLKCGILGQAPGRAVGAALFEGTCPYRGLEVFDIDDARFFFGRDAQVDWMIERLGEDFGTVQESRFLGVVGASGSGKSSLVRAGLVPALREGRSRSGKGLPASTGWPIVVLKPGVEPLKALADALWSHEASRPAVADSQALADRMLEDERRLHSTVGTVLTGAPEERRFVVVVDQFEELFTQCPEDEEDRRRAFIDNLLYASAIRAGRTIVVITLRADFYGKCSRHEKLAHALSDGQELVPPLGETELRTAIEQPAQLCGLELEQGLVDLLLQDMRGQPAGALPLLQQTLLMLWERRRGRKLTVQAYRDIGEIEGALEAHASQLYEERLRSDEERDLCRRVLLMLTTPGEWTEDTRRRVPRAQLGSGEALDAVVQELVKGRLVTVSDTDPPQVEVTHEALIRGWDKLRTWIDADRDSLRTLHQLIDAAETWQQYDRDPAYLYAGSRLVQAEEWRSENAAQLSDLPLAAEFIHAGVDQRHAELRRRSLSRMLFIALAGFIAFGAWAYKERQEVKRSELAARKAFVEVLAVYSRGTMLCGEVAALLIENPSKVGIESKIATLLNPPLPTITTKQTVSQAKSLSRAVDLWDAADATELPALKQSVLRVATAYRDAWSYQKSQMDESSRHFAAKALERSEYDRAIVITRSIAKHGMNQKDVQEFERLYWGELVLFETEAVEIAMVNFGAAITKKKSNQDSLANLGKLANDLEEACRSAIEKL